MVHEILWVVAGDHRPRLPVEEYAVAAHREDASQFTVTTTTVAPILTHFLPIERPVSRNACDELAHRHSRSNQLHSAATQ